MGVTPAGRVTTIKKMSSGSFLQQTLATSFDLGTYPWIESNVLISTILLQLLQEWWKCPRLSAAILPAVAFSTNNFVEIHTVMAGIPFIS